jgi:tetratricopeptide (TPR) repeat protein
MAVDCCRRRRSISTDDMRARSCCSSAMKTISRPRQSLWHGPASLLLIVLLLLFVPRLVASSDPASLVKAADALMAEHHFERARLLYEQALVQGASFGTDLQHARNLGIAYLNSAPPDFEEGIKWLRVASALDPRSDGVRAELAKALLRSGDAEGAIENYRVLVDHNPQSSDYVIGLASALRQAGNTETALEAFRSSLQRSPNLVPVRVEYARLLNFNRQFVEAKRQFSAVLAIDSGNLIAQVGLAKTTSFDGDQESALSMYDRILQRHPGLYDAIVGKAFSLLWSGHLEQARPLLEQAARRNPNDREVREALSQLPGSRFVAQASTAPVEADDAEPDSTTNTTAVRSGHTPARVGKVSQHPPQGITPATSQQSATNALIHPPVSETALKMPAQSSPFLLVLITLVGLVALAALAVLKRSAFRKTRAAAEESPVVPRAQSPFLLPGSCLEGDNTHAHRTETNSNLCDPILWDTVQNVATPNDCSGNGRFSPEEVALERPGPHTNAPEANQSAVFITQPEVLLIGGSENTRALESRRLSALNVELGVECDWSEAVVRLVSTSPELIVLNAITGDGWTSVRMFHWIAANRPELRSRCLAIVSTSEAADELSVHGGTIHFLIEPFDSKKWHEAVSTVLPINAYHHMAQP